MSKIFEVEIATRLRMVRNVAGLTLEQAAVKCGKPSATLSKMELNGSPLTIEAVEAAARGYGIDAAVLLGARERFAAALITGVITRLERQEQDLRAKV